MPKYSIIFFLRKQINQSNSPLEHREKNRKHIWCFPCVGQHRRGRRNASKVMHIVMHSASNYISPLKHQNITPYNFNRTHASESNPPENSGPWIYFSSCKTGSQMPRRWEVMLKERRGATAACHCEGRDETDPVHRICGKRGKLKRGI